jgi:predicted nuclease of predicted toxin-antitoxin system
MQGTATITQVDENGEFIANITTIDLANDDTTFTITPAEGIYYYNISLTDNKYTADNVTITVTTNKITVTMDTEFDEYSDVFGKDINVIVTIKDAEENPITQGTITVYEADELVQTVEVTGDETVITFNYPEAGAHTLVLKYSDDKYTADDKEIVVLAEAKEAVIISEDVDAFVGDNVVITASVECDGVEVTEGQIRFTNSNGEVLAVCDLSDGPATYDYGVVDEEFDDEVTVEFINSDNYYSDSNFIFVEVIKKYADIELTTSEAKVGSPLTVTARVSYEDESLTEGQIVFTDEEGNEIDTVDITDGVATTTVQYDTVGTYTVYAKIINPTYDGKDSIDITIEKIPVTISVIDDQTVAVGDTATITATISSDNAIVNGGKVVFTKGSTILAEVDVTEGSASFDYRPTTSGETTITAKYIPSEIYSIEEDTASCVITAERIATTTTLDEVTLVAGKTVTLTARITADDDSIVDTGKVAFKVNGKTLKDSNGKVIYVKVVNGVASLDYTVSDSLLGNSVSIEAVYSGSNKYVNSKDKDSELSVMSGVADIEITSPNTVTKGQIATFTVKVTDNNVNVNEGKVILKINGKTLKNTEGKVIYAPVVDGIAMVEYLIPDTMKSKDYTLSAVFVSSNYSRCVDEQTLTVQ